MAEQKACEIDDDLQMVAKRVVERGVRRFGPGTRIGYIEEEVARALQRERAETLRHLENLEHYGDLLDEIGAAIGVAAHVRDDGTWSPEVLRAKLPELSRALHTKRIAKYHEADALRNALAALVCQVRAGDLIGITDELRRSEEALAMDWRPPHPDAIDRAKACVRLDPDKPPPGFVAIPVSVATLPSGLVWCPEPDSFSIEDLTQVNARSLAEVPPRSAGAMQRSSSSAVADAPPPAVDHEKAAPAHRAISALDAAARSRKAWP
jgi:hypothetical protein